MKQVDKEAYKFERYSHLGRWVSYYYQISEVLKLVPLNILEVGMGDGVFRDYIKNNISISYTSLDIAQDLYPDVVGDVTKLPFPDRSFDVVCVFEVLEHLPFKHFERALTELHRVARQGVVLSLPHFGPPVKFLLKIPFLPEVSFSFKIPFAKRHIFNGQHYWEIGKRGYSPNTIRKIIQKLFSIKKEFIPFENQYHHFFVLIKKHE
ncbi:MAG: class I SAM-dependent methyltransferase [Patescibacteria group bacterium]